MNLNKSQIRKDTIQKRNNLSESEHLNKSSCICKKIMETSFFKEASVVYAYMDIKNEVSLKELIDYCLKNGKTIALPRVEGKVINFYQIQSFSDLEEGSFHVAEPKMACQEAPAADLILVPGVAFTKEGYRLGYGGGFYDRFLAENDIYSIGIGYHFQIKQKLPLEQHDICLNQIITD